MLVVGAHLRENIYVYLWSVYKQQCKITDTRPLSIREAPRPGGTGGASTGSGSAPRPRGGFAPTPRLQVHAPRSPFGSQTLTLEPQVFVSELAYIE